MTRASFRFYPDLWMGNRSLRACSPAARGFWVDLLSLCYPTGYLVHPNGAPIDDEQLSRIVGEPIKSVRVWIRELGDAGIFAISQDGKLCSNRMVKEAAFTAQAKVAGARGQKIKKHNARHAGALQASAMVAVGSAVGDGQTAAVVATAAGLVAIDNAGAAKTASAPLAPARKTLDWWRSPAGWARKANEQAMSMQPGEIFEDFQIRVAARLPFGPHLDVLSVGQVRAVEAAQMRAQEAALPGSTKK